MDRQFSDRAFNALYTRYAESPTYLANFREIYGTEYPKGSHRQFKHFTKPGRVTVVGKPGDDVAPGTLSRILKQAGLKK
jgi:hypothetical protein